MNGRRHLWTAAGLPSRVSGINNFQAHPRASGRRAYSSPHYPRTIGEDGFLNDVSVIRRAPFTCRRAHLCVQVNGRPDDRRLRVFLFFRQQTIARRNRWPDNRYSYCVSVITACPFASTFNVPNVSNKTWSRDSNLSRSPLLSNSIVYGRVVLYYRFMPLNLAKMTHRIVPYTQTNVFAFFLMSYLTALLCLKTAQSC